MTKKIQRQPALRTLLLHGSAAAVVQWSSSYTERGTGGMEKETAMLTLFAETLKQNYTTEALTYLMIESPGMCTLVRGVSVLVHVYVCLCVCAQTVRIIFCFYVHVYYTYLSKRQKICVSNISCLYQYICVHVCIYIYTHQFVGNCDVIRKVVMGIQAQLLKC